MRKKKGGEDCPVTVWDKIEFNSRLMWRSDIEDHREHIIQKQIIKLSK
jgi:hypothetical protein